MNGTNLSSHQERLKIVFRLQLELLRELIFTNKYKATAQDMANLLSDLIEIRQTAQSIKQMEYLR